MIEKWLTPAKRPIGDYPPRKKIFARETEKMLFDDRGRKTLKRNDYQIYHDTEQQAIKHMAMLFSQEKARSDSQRIKESAPALLESLQCLSEAYACLCRQKDLKPEINMHYRAAIAAIAAARGE